MFLKYVDFLSPTITLYYHGINKHSSVVSGILTIIHYLFLLGATIFYVYSLFVKANPTFFYFKQYVEEPGIFSMGPSEIFHFLTLDSSEYDSSTMSIIGVQLGYNDYIDENTELEKNYWRYSPCLSSVHAPPELTMAINTNSGLCITEFYNHTIGKTIKFNDPEFRYPNLTHGTGTENAIYYAVILQGCQNNTAYSSKKVCSNREAVKESLGKISGLSFFVADQYISVENYTNPMKKYLQKIDVMAYEDNIVVTTLHFSPTKIKTHMGLLFDTIRDLRTYSFDQSAVGSYTSGDTTMISVVTLTMHNEVDFYERSYLKFPDILASISGLEKFSYIIFFIINLFYNRFITISDFNTLFIDVMAMKSRVDKKKTLFTSTGIQIPSIRFSRLTKSSPTESTKIEKKQIKNNISLGHTLSHYFKLSKKNTYISKLISFRRKIISEEKVLLNDFRMEKLFALFFDENRSLDSASIYDTSVLGNQLKMHLKGVSITKVNNSNSNIELIHKD